jgi:hypothetical protein
MNCLVRRMRFHRNRAERFQEHAFITKSPEGRERYLRFAAHELGFAQCLEAQARVDAEVRDSSLIAAAG